MRGLAVVALVDGLFGSGVALGAGGEPKKQLNPADQARARAMLLKKADLGLSSMPFRMGRAKKSSSTVPLLTSPI
jgi:hypothetical protein